MALPGANNKTLNDLVPDVLEALQQRTDVSTLMACRYMRKAIIELTESTPFEELRRTGPQINLSTGQYSYPVSLFLNPNDDYSFPESAVLFVDVGTNQVTQPVDYMTPKGIEPLVAPVTTGTPSWFTRYGTNFFFGPTPNNAYTTFLRYQVKHPFPDAPSGLPAQTLFMPDSWEEIVVYGAALRIALIKRWNDQVKVLHDVLYGDPEFLSSEGKRGRPGILAARLLQVERDQKFNARRLGILVPRYTR